MFPVSKLHFLAQHVTNTATVSAQNNYLQKVKIIINLARLTSAIMWKESWTVLWAALKCLSYRFWGPHQWQLIKLQISSLGNDLFNWQRSYVWSKMYLSLQKYHCTMLVYGYNKVLRGRLEGAWHQLSIACAVLLSHHRACQQHLCFSCSDWSSRLLWRKV